ncbi:MAG: molybdopterin-dependent oxidoreductase, partial [Pseudomonadota bacterium]
MKFDRRGFIKFVAGGAVGLHLTPLPWKIIDDIAIWTQNWPWVPRVTRYPSFSHSQTVCTLCPGGCGIRVRMVNGKRTIKVDGQEEAPINQGKVCPLGAAGTQYQYALSRFKGPVKRVAARGAGVWQKVSWEDAFKEVGSRLAELRQKKMAQTVVMISSRHSSLTKALTARFMQAYGSPNLIFTPSLGLAADFAQRAQFGPQLKDDQELFQRLQLAQENSLGYDLEHADYVLSFGCGVIEGWGSPVRSIQAYSAWRAGGKAKLIQIDTWASLTASKADEWIAVRPGSDGALALGMAHVMVKEGLFNAKFVSEHTHGFDAFKAMLLKDYAPAAVQLLTGVSPTIITKLARQFAQAKRPLAIAGRGKGSLPTPVYELMAVMSLNALAGNINQPGGVNVRQDLPLKSWAAAEPDEEVKECLAAPRLDLARSRKYPLTTSLLQNFLESVQEDRFYPVNVLILDQANPAFLGADPTAFQAALRKIPLVVSLSGVADDSS